MLEMNCCYSTHDSACTAALVEPAVSVSRRWHPTSLQDRTEAGLGPAGSAAGGRPRGLPRPAPRAARVVRRPPAAAAGRRRRSEAGGALARAAPPPVGVACQGWAESRRARNSRTVLQGQSISNRSGEVSRAEPHCSWNRYGNTRACVEWGRPCSSSGGSSGCGSVTS
jgi:hypothetical protein